MITTKLYLVKTSGNKFTWYLYFTGEPLKNPADERKTISRISTGITVTAKAKENSTKAFKAEEKKAIVFEGDVISKLAAGDLSFLPKRFTKKTARKEYNVLELVSNYTSDTARDGFFKPKSTNQTTTALKYMAKALKKEAVMLTDLNAENLREFKDYLIEAYENPEVRMNIRTAASYFNMIKITIGKLAANKDIEFDYPNHLQAIKGISMKKASIIVKQFLTADELEKLEETPPQNFKWANQVLFSCKVGFRPESIEALCWGDVVKNKDGSYTITDHMNKTSKENIVKVSPQTRAYLGERGDADGKVFSEYPYKSKEFRERLTSWVVYSGAKNKFPKQATDGLRFTAHCCRHTCAVNLAARNVPIYIIQKVLGHSDTAMTAKYLSSLKAGAEDARFEITL